MTVERQVRLYSTDPLDIKRANREYASRLFGFRIFLSFSRLKAVLCLALHVLSWVEVDIGAIHVLGRLMPRLLQYSFRELDVLLLELTVVLVVLEQLHHQHLLVRCIRSFCRRS